MTAIKELLVDILQFNSFIEHILLMIKHKTIWVSEHTHDNIYRKKESSETFEQFLVKVISFWESYK